MKKGKLNLPPTKKPKNEIKVLVERLIFLLQHKDGLVLSDSRLRYLRSYTQALVQVPLEAVDEKHMLVDELILIFLCAAQFVLLSRPLSKNFKPTGKEKLTTQLLGDDDAEG